MNNLLKTAVREERIDEIRYENYQGKLPRSRWDDEKLNQQGCIAGLTSLEDAPTSAISYPASSSRIIVLLKTLRHIIENPKKKSERKERSFRQNGKKEIIFRSNVINKKGAKTFRCVAMFLVKVE